MIVINLIEYKSNTRKKPFFSSEKRLFKQWAQVCARLADSSFTFHNAILA
ncbi:hypothetical protein HDC92_000410 [Pedobacter sp. AK017]|nr:hypothetical protein [Pedobacter sp. AK017]